jgi:hypothetical protein
MQYAETAAQSTPAGTCTLGQSNQTYSSVNSNESTFTTERHGLAAHVENYNGDNNAQKTLGSFKKISKN